MFAATALADAMSRAGVRDLFTLCGGHIMALYDGCRARDIRIIDVRHEANAVLAADAYARITRKPSVAAITAGAGITYGLTGLAQAYANSSPVIVLCGQAPLLRLDRGDLQEIDALSIVRPVTRAAWRIHDAERIPEYFAMALRAAWGPPRGPVFLELPLDVLMDSRGADLPPEWQAPSLPGPTCPSDAAIEHAATLLREASRPVLLAGSDTWWSGDEGALQRFVEAWRIPSILNGMARGLLPPNHPLLLKRARGKALAETDLALIVGMPIDFRVDFGKSFPEEARIVHVLPHAAWLARNREVDLSVAADVTPFLSALAARSPRPAPETWSTTLQDLEHTQRAKDDANASSDDSPIHPLRLCRELRDAITPEDILVLDGGDVVSLAAPWLSPGRPGAWLDTGPLATLGVGLPYAIGAKVAAPNRPVLALLGDGAFGFSAMELDTAARHNLGFVAVIANNSSWWQIEYGQAAIFGEDHIFATRLEDRPYHTLAETLGACGERIERPEHIRPAIERARSARTPYVLNVAVSRSTASRSTKRMYMQE